MKEGEADDEQSLSATLVPKVRLLDSAAGS